MDKSLLATFNSRLGFMQGRLVPMVDDQIQSFPTDTWYQEYPLAQKLHLTKQEWTLDYDNLYKNPLLSLDMHQTIMSLCASYHIQIPSVTCDFFMQHPFWSSHADFHLLDLLDLIIDVADACNHLGISLLVIPLVDNSSLSSLSTFLRAHIVSSLKSISQSLYDLSISLAFESDLAPCDLLLLMNEFDKPHYGINYDTGNSASLGFKPQEEFDSYLSYILNVHIKDRIYKGTTVPLGYGDASLGFIIPHLLSSTYAGNFILQTARSSPGMDVPQIALYIQYLHSLLNASPS